MLLSSTTDQDINFLKFSAEMQMKNQKIQHFAAQRLKEILYDDQITVEEFTKEFNKILASTQSFNWKIRLFLGEIKNRFVEQISPISWFQISIVVCLFSLLYFLYKKYKLKKQATLLYKVIVNILERFSALLAYFLPLVIVYESYLIYLLPTYPYLNLIAPNFMLAAVTLYMKNKLVMNYGYFFGVIACLSLKFPKSRFVRFHLVRGLLFIAFQGLPDLFLNLFQMFSVTTNAQQLAGTFTLFTLYLVWIIPCLYQALTHTYPKNSFMREAIEINVGRDRDDDFKWWDRK